MSRIEKARKMRQRVSMGVMGAIKSGAVDGGTVGGLVTEWKPAIEWLPDEICVYNGRLYKCLKAHKSKGNLKPPTSPEYWEDIGAAAADA